MNMIPFGQNTSIRAKVSSQSLRSRTDIIHTVSIQMVRISLPADSNIPEPGTTTTGNLARSLQRIRERYADFRPHLPDAAEGCAELAEQ